MSHPAPARRAPSLPRPDLQERLLAAIRARDAVAGARLIDQWVHRRGIASLAGVRDGVVASSEDHAAVEWFDALLAGAVAAPLGAAAAVAVAPAIREAAESAPLPAPVLAAEPLPAPVLAAEAVVTPDPDLAAAMVVEEALTEYRSLLESESPPAHAVTPAPPAPEPVAFAEAAAPPAPEPASLDVPLPSFLAFLGGAAAPDAGSELGLDRDLDQNLEPELELELELDLDPELGTEDIAPSDGAAGVPSGGRARWTSVFSRVRTVVRDRLEGAVGGLRFDGAPAEQEVDPEDTAVPREESPAPQWGRPPAAAADTSGRRPAEWPHLFEFPRRASRPAPPPADLADLRAWLPGPSDELPKAS